MPKDHRYDFGHRSFFDDLRLVFLFCRLRLGGARRRSFRSFLDNLFAFSVLDFGFQFRKRLAHFAAQTLVTFDNRVKIFF